MSRTRARLEDVLSAAQALIAAREDQMITVQEWRDLIAAVEACQADRRLHPFAVRTETFLVAGGDLVRRVDPGDGDPYEHRCPLGSYERVALTVAHMGRSKEPFTLSELHASVRDVAEYSVPWSQVGVAFAFMRERSVVVPAGKRRHAPAGSTPYEDAMIEYHALREMGPDG